MDAEHVVVVRNIPARLGAERNAGAAAQSELFGIFDHRLRAHLEPGLVEPSVARLRERLTEIEPTGVLFFPVAKNMVPHSEGGRAGKGLFRIDATALQARETDEGLEGRARRIGRSKRARQERIRGIVREGVENGRLHRGNKIVRVEGRPRGEREDFAVVRIEHGDRAALGVFR